jgi:putative heme transporter
VVWLLTKLLVVSLPLIAALIVSTLAVPPARWLESKGLKPGMAAGIVVIGGLAVIIGVLVALTPSFVDQLSELGATLRQAWADVLTWLETSPFNYDREQVEALLASIGEAATSNGGSLAAGLLTGAAVVVQLLAGLVLLIVVLFFFVKDGEDIVNWFLERTPPRHRDTVVATGRRAWIAMSGYVRGTALIALIDAAGIAVGLIVLRVPLVAPLTLLVFLGGFLPVVGAAAAGLVAVLVALAVGGPAKALLVLAWIVVVQQVEGNLLQPTIMRRAVALHPVVILVALTAGAALAGIVGAFLAVPVAAVVAAIGNELRLRAEFASESGASAP